MQHHSALTVVLLLAGTAVLGFQVPELVPTPLEAFAARPGAKVIWSMAVGAIEGPAARATAVAIAIDDASATPRLQRGLRIDLTHLEPNPNCDQIYWDWRILCARPNAAIYLEEDRLDHLPSRFMEMGQAPVHLGHYGGITSYRMNGSPHSGLIIVGYTLEGVSRAAFSDLLERGATALKDAPR